MKSERVDYFMCVLERVLTEGGGEIRVELKESGVELPLVTMTRADSE